MKILIKAILGILGLILIAIVIVGLALDALIKTGLETLGPQLLKAPVIVKNVDLSLFSGQGELEGLVIHNPPGFQTEYAVKVDRVRVEMDAPSALSNVIVIRKLVIDGPEIVFEGSVSGRRRNIHTLRRNVEQRGGESDSPPRSKPDQRETQVQVDDLVISNAKVKLSVVGLQGQGITIPLGDIRLRHLGKVDGRRTIGTVVAQVLNAVEDAVLEAVAKNDRLFKEGVSAAEEAVKDLSGELGSTATKALQELKGLLEN
ncbi:MAG: hypothetical protein D6690_13060 [Nitrospirae bacterium]|nr:MAG: hypothetical protein D6690_13060 [Nitrospirota bacterium]